MVLRISSLRSEPAFAITESPRPLPEEGSGPAFGDEVARVRVELERVGKVMYRLSLGQESVIHSIERLAEMIAKERAPWAGRLAEDFLPLMDALQRLSRALERQGAVPRPHLGEGARIVEAKGAGYLAALGIEAIPAVGSRFDPSLQQVLETRAVPPEQDGVVLEEIVRGYRMGDRVLRHAQVVVGKFEAADPHP